MPRLILWCILLLFSCLYKCIFWQIPFFLAQHKLETDLVTHCSSSWSSWLLNQSLNSISKSVSKPVSKLRSAKLVSISVTKFSCQTGRWKTVSVLVTNNLEIVICGTHASPDWKIREQSLSLKCFSHSCFWLLFQSLNLLVTDFDDVATENSVSKRLISYSEMPSNPFELTVASFFQSSAMIDEIKSFEQPLKL